MAPLAEELEACGPHARAVILAAQPALDWFLELTPMGRAPAAHMIYLKRLGGGTPGAVLSQAHKSALPGGHLRAF